MPDPLLLLAKTAPPPGGPGQRATIHVPIIILFLLLIMAGTNVWRGLLDTYQDQAFVLRYGLLIFFDGQFLWDRLYTVITSAFLHEGWLHFFFNGFWFCTVGTLCHRALGDWRFLLLCLLCAVGAAAAQTLLTLNEAYLTIGASGVAFGLFGAFSHLQVIKPSMALPEKIRKLCVFGIIILLINFAIAYVASRGLPGDRGVAWQAHAGGFMTGLIFFPFLRPRAKAGSSV